MITPYNAQVRRIAQRVPGVRVGTVDKFQGQEAPIAIYSMATSSQEEAPRGMEFLYSLNRLNVATSRARLIAIVVASPSSCESAVVLRARSAWRTRSRGWQNSGKSRQRPRVTDPLSRGGHRVPTRSGPRGRRAGPAAGCGAARRGTGGGPAEA